MAFGEKDAFTNYVRKKIEQRKGKRKRGGNWIALLFIRKRCFTVTYAKKTKERARQGVKGRKERKRKRDWKFLLLKKRRVALTLSTVGTIQEGKKKGGSWEEGEEGRGRKTAARSRDSAKKDESGDLLRRRKKKKGGKITRKGSGEIIETVGRNNLISGGERDTWGRKEKERKTLG